MTYAPRREYERCVYIRGASSLWGVDTCTSAKYYICEFGKMFFSCFDDLRICTENKNGFGTIHAVLILHV